MGCGESKIRQIKLTSKADWDLGQEEQDRSKQLWTAATKETDWQGLDTRGVLPNSLLASIPTNDLGESLDTRHILGQDATEDNSEADKQRAAPFSANSLGNTTSKVSIHSLSNVSQTVDMMSMRMSMLISSLNTVPRMWWRTSSNSSSQWTCQSSWSSQEELAQGREIIFSSLVNTFHFPKDHVWI